jgi:hypothetical protein
MKNGEDQGFSGLATRMDLPSEIPVFIFVHI